MQTFQIEIWFLKVIFPHDSHTVQLQFIQFFKNMNYIVWALEMESHIFYFCFSPGTFFEDCSFLLDERILTTTTRIQVQKFEKPISFFYSQGKICYTGAAFRQRCLSQLRILLTFLFEDSKHRKLAPSQDIVNTFCIKEHSINHYSNDEQKKGVDKKSAHHTLRFGQLGYLRAMIGGGIEFSLEKREQRSIRTSKKQLREFQMGGQGHIFLLLLRTASIIQIGRKGNTHTHAHENKFGMTFQSFFSLFEN